VFLRLLEFGRGGARVANSPIVAITLISVDVRPGDSIVAMAALFSCS
jgi:hypothetical protein